MKTARAGNIPKRHGIVGRFASCVILQHFFGPFGTFGLSGRNVSKTPGSPKRWSVSSISSRSFGARDSLGMAVAASCLSKIASLH